MCERYKSLLMFLACFYLRETSYILIRISPLTDDFPPPASGKKKQSLILHFQIPGINRLDSSPPSILALIHLA